MEDKAFRLVHILQEKFVAPEKTNGENILFTFKEILDEIKLIWNPDGGEDGQKKWEHTDLIEALEYLNFDHIRKLDGERAYLFARK
ncbi:MULTISPECIES: hypothetical protein [Olivibacter]|uniref:Uncharacterized protein n=1 Tax=Olivibacter jilunii TaxID=985016 RepID=A0ABW6AZX7_9SPHI